MSLGDRLAAARVSVAASLVIKEHATGVGHDTVPTWLCNSWLQTKVAGLRIKELQECLERLRERKTGRKNELQHRLLTALDDTKL